MRSIGDGPNPTSLSPGAISTDDPNEWKGMSNSLSSHDCAHAHHQHNNGHFAVRSGHLWRLAVSGGQLDAALSRKLAQ